jgi:hypothetical protein
MTTSYAIRTETIRDHGADPADPRAIRGYLRDVSTPRHPLTRDQYVHRCRQIAGDRQIDGLLLDVGYCRRSPADWMRDDTTRPPAFGTFVHFCAWYHAAVERAQVFGSPYHPAMERISRAYWAHVPAEWVRRLGSALPMLPERLSRIGWRRLAWALRAARRQSARYVEGHAFVGWARADVSLKVWARLGSLPAAYQRFALVDVVTAEREPGSAHQPVVRLRDLNWALVARYQAAMSSGDAAEIAAWTEVAEWRVPTSARAAEIYREHFGVRGPIRWQWHSDRERERHSGPVVWDDDAVVEAIRAGHDEARTIAWREIPWSALLLRECCPPTAAEVATALEVGPEIALELREAGGDVPPDAIRAAWSSPHTYMSWDVCARTYVLVQDLIAGLVTPERLVELCHSPSLVSELLGEYRGGPAHAPIVTAIGLIAAQIDTRWYLYQSCQRPASSARRALAHKFRDYPELGAIVAPHASAIGLTTGQVV